MMNFIKHFINKYGVLVGGGSLAIVLVSAVLLVYATRGVILVLVPAAVMFFIVLELLDYFIEGRNRKP